MYFYHSYYYYFIGRALFNSPAEVSLCAVAEGFQRDFLPLLVLRATFAMLGTGRMPGAPGTSGMRPVP